MAKSCIHTVRLPELDPHASGQYLIPQNCAKTEIPQKWANSIPRKTVASNDTCKTA